VYGLEGERLWMETGMIVPTTCIFWSKVLPDHRGVGHQRLSSAPVDRWQKANGSTGGGQSSFGAV
jgi:hypothetical protein